MTKKTKIDKICSILNKSNGKEYIMPKIWFFDKYNEGDALPKGFRKGDIILTSTQPENDKGK